ncbi:MAG: LysR family transcriptional regulator [Caldimonas sp.]
MTTPRHVLTPEALTMMVAIAESGSFAAAARLLGKVPSALTYNVRQLEDALDVLLFDRRSRQARLTAAGQELLDEGRRLLEQVDAIANRVKRVATGWETQLTIAVDDVLSRVTLFELCEAFYAAVADPPGGRSSRAGAEPAAAAGPATRLRLRTEVLSGTWEALVTGRADLAIGVGMHRELPRGIAMKELGKIDFVFAVAPHHPLATAIEPIDNSELVRHRAVAVADSAAQLAAITLNLLPGQDVLTVSSMQAKIDAQLRGLGCGFVPEPLACDHIATGRLVVKTVRRARQEARLGYAWREPTGAAGSTRRPPPGLALGWWLERLESAPTRKALLERHGSRIAGASR